MNALLECPYCNAHSIDLTKFKSMIVIASDHALFSVKCPACGAVASSVHPIPERLRDEVSCAAHEVGAGMGFSS